jgi:hypothetical protein
LAIGLGVWAELLADRDVEAALPELARCGCRLGLSLGSARLGDPEIARLTRRAAELGVPVRAWLLLPRADGYWIGETNAERFVLALERLCEWRRRPGGPVFDAVSVDLEPAYDYSEALRTAKKSRPVAWLRLLASHVDPGRFEAARDLLARGVDRTRAAGLPVHAVTYPLLLDQPEGELALEDALDTPVTDIDWDELSVMVYQTAFAQQLGLWLGPDLVRSYALACVRRFGDRAGLDLGVIGSLGLGLEPGDRYPTPAALQADVAAALSAGIPLARIRVYGLAGAIEAGGISRWLELGDLAPRVPEPSREVAGVRNGARLVCLAVRELWRQMPKR